MVSIDRSGVGYECTGDMSEWTKCPNKTKTPDRKEFKVPKEFCVEFSFLWVHLHINEVDNSDHVTLQYLNAEM